MSKVYSDLSGLRFGRWTVIEEAEPKYYSGRRIRYWLCKCECGVTKAVKEQSLLDGSSQSCGCRHSEIMKDVGRLNIKHGQTDTRLYRIYKHMWNRCNYKKDVRYSRYGGRGIKVCDEWNTFEAFYEWALRSGYDETKSIDRINNNGDYSPDNCRWADNVTQANNKSNVVQIEFRGDVKSMAEWARELGMPYKKLYKRFRSGWDIERALTT